VRLKFTGVVVLEIFGSFTHPRRDSFERQLPLAVIFLIYVVSIELGMGIELKSDWSCFLAYGWNDSRCLGIRVCCASIAGTVGIGGCLARNVLDIVFGGRGDCLRSGPPIRIMRRHE
jgi:hypothetical protein